MFPMALIAIYCLLIIAASLLGGWLPVVVRLTHTRMQLMMSAVGGLMLGVGILHMLPHGILETGSLDWAMGGLLLGLLTTFFLMRLFHFHEHAPVEEEYPGTAAGDHEHGGHLHCDHDHSHSPPKHSHNHDDNADSKMRWLGVFLGLSLHTLLDGIALAAGVSAAAHHEPVTMGLIGFGVFLGIFLHKPLDALSITFIMRQSKWPLTTINIVNLGYALMCPLGVLLFFAGYNGLDASKQFMVGMALCFSAGVFLCISLADILPEVQFHSHDKVKLSLVMLLGVGVAYLIGFAEPGGLHDHSKDNKEKPVEVAEP
ncbi:ZIP family metal transporter [Bremerella sp. T1]|uniref:ZIP family metal transporter n=1 Tax=Bremerella sp. TYQ1 TaxID=3119568 RepID=UPI001CCBFF84|nr:ZIP family metal transporter [Bremerella volcania]UBM35087.1 ZIP family metal transporter [Bremerella volcania]